MRDGIPRTLPVPRKWQRVIESADRAADRGTDRVTSRLCDAIQDDLRRDFRDVERRWLIALAAEPIELFSPLAHGGALDDMDKPTMSPAMQRILAAARGHYDNQASAKDAIERALLEYAEQCVAARRRQIREDLATKTDASEVNKVMSEYDRAVSEARVQEEISKFIKDSDASSGAKPGKLTADEDLRGRPR
ncbi:MAG TPA: hypothetical protein VN633_11345 [Bryobacteraceae bacterium]|nr:hypothetical protein [Bryobacteraceae bacterium]HZR61429.1 hypothetical protein [Xanthobacteraceae bacterium]